MTDFQWNFNDNTICKQFKNQFHTLRYFADTFVPQQFVLSTVDGI